MFGFITAGISAVSNAAKSLFSGEGKAARQEKKAEKKAVKAATKAAKAAEKAAVAGGSAAGAKAGEAFTAIKNWIVANWMYIAIGVASIIAIWFLFFRSRKSSGGRRRSKGRKAGSKSMKARMAKVRSARKRKRK